MDFFARQDRTRRTSRYLLLLFGLAFVAVALVTTVVVTLLVEVFSNPAGMAPVAQQPLAVLGDRVGLLAGVAAGSFGLMLLASGYRSASLSRGGGQVARMLGATPIGMETNDPLERRLINVTEEMSIASGVPVPELYVLEQEPGINAFAAGLTQSDAAVAVTRGALERLNRAELQGVIAHEISHVVNGDMRLNQRLIGFSFGILVLSLVGRWILRGSAFRRRSRGRGAGAVLAAGLALTLVGAVGVLLSRLIKAGVSRQRESLADASAVQFTREPVGLANALKKIGGFKSSMSSVETEEVAHMLFGEGRRRFAGWLSTHPPLAERIRALDPTFVPGQYPEPGTPLPEAGAEDGAPVSGLSAASAAEPALLERVGQSESPAVGETLLAALPEELRHAAHSRDSSPLVVLALALSSETAVATRQQQLLEARIGAARTRRCLQLREQLTTLDMRLRLPLLELCVPALRQRPVEQLDFLFDLVERLLDLDGERQLFDYVLLRLLTAHLSERPDSSFDRRASPRERRAGAAVVDLLAVTAAYGHREPDAARAAFRAGLDALGRQRKAPQEPDFADLDRLRDPGRLDAPLAKLATLPGTAKRRVLAALLAVIRHDRRVRIEEIELFRAIAATLGIPVPPTASLEAVDERPGMANMAGN